MPEGWEHYVLWISLHQLSEILWSSLSETEVIPYLRVTFWSLLKEAEMIQLILWSSFSETEMCDQ